MATGPARPMPGPWLRLGCHKMVSAHLPKRPFFLAGAADWTKRRSANTRSIADVGAVVGAPDGEAVGSVVGTVDGTPEGCQVFHVGSVVGTLVGSGDGGVVGTALGTKEK